MSEYTFGVEEEYFLLERGSYLQGHMSEDFYKSLHSGYYGTSLTDEVFDSHLEARTSVCTDIKGIAAGIKRMRKHANLAANYFGLTIASSGTMPVVDWRDVKVIAPPAEKIVSTFGNAFQTQSIAGLHLHIKVGDLEQSLKVLNYLGWYAWIFAALSGSSRYYDGRDTGVSSYRLALMRQTARTGLAPFYRIGNYYAEKSALEECGWAENKLWYYIRFNPRIETVELRICDSVPHVDDAVALAELFVQLAVAIRKRKLRPPQDALRLEPAFKIYAEENIDRAMCFGTKAVDVYSGDDIETTLRKLPIDVPAGIWHILKRGNTSELLEPIWEEKGSAGVAKYIAEETVRKL